MNDQTNEQEAVRTTVTGGEAPRNRGSNIGVPRGIEVLLKKAAVDPDFRQLLLEQRGGAAAAIGLELDSSEEAILKGIPHKQLVQTITHTVVPMEQRRVFLGRVAAAMLAVVGVGLAGCEPAESAGTRPDRPAPARPQPNDTGSNAAPATTAKPEGVPSSSQAGSTNPPTPTSQPLSRGISPDRP